MPSTRTRRTTAPATFAWHASPTLGLALVVLASLLTWLVAFNGPSLVTLEMGPGTLLPSYHLPTGRGFLSDGVAVGLLWTAVLTGAVALSLLLRALARGWRPRVARLVWLGVALHVGTALVPPVTSGDVLMYASYGRLQALGQDPYTITPADIFRSQYDPVLRWTEQPWHDTPSVYGPIASFTQVAASWLGGESMHQTVWFLQLVTMVPLVLIGLLCVLLARRDPAAQARAAVLTLCNPLLLWSVAAGAHNEALAVLLGLAGLAMMRRSPFLAGLGIGLGGCVKATMVFYGLAMLWAYRRQPRKLAELCVGAATPMVLCYVLWQPSALLAAARNSGGVSKGSWAWLVRAVLNPVITPRFAQWTVSLGALVLLVLVVYALWRMLPWRPVPRLLRTEDPRRDPLTDSIRAAVVLSAAWLVTSPYSLPWYDLIAWAPLAALAPSVLDWLLLWRGTWLSLALVVSRPLPMSVGMRKISNALYWVSEYAQLAVLLAIGWWWWSSRRHEGSERLVRPSRPLRRAASR